MSFLLDIFKKSKKGDAYRIVEAPVKYNDQIAALNSGGPVSKNNNSITTANISKVSATYTANDSRQSKLPS
jgi:hypothetical protein